MLKILSFTKLNDSLAAVIKDARPDVELVCAAEKNAAPYLPDADILLGFGGMVNWAAVMPQAPNVKWVQTLSAGVDRLTAMPDFVAGDIILTNAKGIHGIPMGEHVLGYMLGFNRRLYLAHDQQKAHLWQPTPRLGEIYGQTAAIIGLGAVGQGIARTLKLMGMTVVGVKQHVAPLENIDRVYSQSELDVALAQADYVIVTLPVTPETRDLFNLARFRQMKPTAVFINVSRGETIVDDDLITALKENVIAGAALDVFRTEPLPPDSPLWDAPRLIVTPHNAALSPMYLPRIINIFAENLRVFPDAAKMKNVVDKVRGY